MLVLGLAVSTSFMAAAQTTEAEGNLKSASKDTTDGWKKGGVISLNFSQVSLTNWAAGGQNTVSVNGLFSVFANYKKGDLTWENSLDVGYGVLKQGRKEANWLKTDDKFDLVSKLGKKATGNLYYAGLLNFKTQMANGYNLPNDSVAISGLMAPAYLLGAVGMDYKPNDNFSAFVAPLTLKSTFVLDQTLADAGAFGVEAAERNELGEVLTAGKQYRAELGGYVKFQYKTEVMTNVNLLTKLDLFSNYLNNPQNIDVSWEVLVSMKINKYLSANLTTHLLYDDDIDIAVDNNNDGIVDEVGPRVQFKEVFGAGLSYKF